VGSRCIHVAPGVGAVVTQASTNPRLGYLGLNLLRAGYSAPRVLDEIAASDQFVERRQLGCLDTSGLAAARTGSGNRPWAGHRGRRNVRRKTNRSGGAADRRGDVRHIPKGRRPAALGATAAVTRGGKGSRRPAGRRDVQRSVRRRSRAVPRGGSARRSASHPGRRAAPAPGCLLSPPPPLPTSPPRPPHPPPRPRSPPP